MARNKKNTIIPAQYGLTQQNVDRVIHIHDMCKGFDEIMQTAMEIALPDKKEE